MNKYKIPSVIITSGILLLAFAVISGCGKSSGGGATLAQIGNSRITAASFNERISRLPDRYQKAIKKRKKDFLEGLINDTLLYQEAVKKGLHKDKDVIKVIEEARKKILIARLLKDEVDDAVEITNDDVLVYYDENKSEYMTPEIMRVSHILVQSQGEAEEILGRLEKGEGFEDLAKAKSVDPTAQRGGDIGYFPRGQLMPKFENACAKLDIGQTSGIVKTNLGYHIIKLTDRIQPEQKPLERVAESIRSKLRTTERKRVFNDLLGRLREQTSIKINEEVLSGLEEEPEALKEKE